MTRSHFAVRSPLKDAATPAFAEVQLHFLFSGGGTGGVGVGGVVFFPHHFSRLELKNGARGEFNTTSASALNSCALAELLFSFNRLDCTVAILICHSVKNTSGPCSIKSPSKSPTLTAKPRTLKGSPLNGIRHSLTASCLL